MRTTIQGITFILPRDAKLSKAAIATSYGKGTHFNLNKQACENLHAAIKKAEAERKSAK